NDSKTNSSPYFFLKQNDVVYVEPSDARAGQADYNQNNSFKVSVVSAIVSGVSVITTLVIALVINK
ncbi:MAG: polysaccharide export protein, partial [Muribaculaceae bacterium]|nr:polysaccharide export protein [Muribaculaceae bacterium]